MHVCTTAPLDDHWSGFISEIILEDDIPAEAFAHIKDFSQPEILFYFDRVNPADIVFSGRPRGNPAYPLTGIFTQRKKDRPNQPGLCTVKLIAHEEIRSRCAASMP